MAEKETDEELKQFVLETLEEKKESLGSPEDFEKQRDALVEIIAGRKTPQEVMQLDDILLEALYGYGYHLYNNGQYGKAILLFRLLTTLNPSVPKFFLGLAASLHMAEEYLLAMGMYVYVAGLEKDSPIPYYHASDCYQKLGELKSAYIMMKLAWQRMGDNPKYQRLKEKTELKLNGLMAKIAKENKKEAAQAEKSTEEVRERS